MASDTYLLTGFLGMLIAGDPHWRIGARQQAAAVRGFSLTDVPQRSTRKP
jgi:hypothetical protein